MDNYSAFERAAGRQEVRANELEKFIDTINASAEKEEQRYEQAVADGESADTLESIRASIRDIYKRLTEVVDEHATLAEKTERLRALDKRTREALEKWQPRADEMQ